MKTRRDYTLSVTPHLLRGLGRLPKQSTENHRFSNRMPQQVRHDIIGGVQYNIIGERL